MAALGFQALRLKTPRTGGGRLGKRTEAEAELEETEIELGNVGGDAAGSVGRAAEWVAAVPYNSQSAEGVVVEVGKYYTRVGQQVGAVDIVVEGAVDIVVEGAVDIVVEGAAGSGFVAQVLPRWAYIHPGRKLLRQ
jgi:hypothetical protein